MIKIGGLIHVFILSTVGSFAQSDFSIKGKVVDGETGQPLEYATITVKNSSIGVISNLQGEFEFHIPLSYSKDTLVVSMLGFESYRKLVSSMNPEVSIRLVRKTIMLNDVIVRDKELSADEIISRAVKSIRTNYITRPYMMEAFLRQVQKIDNRYVSVLEAALDISDQGYGSKTPEKIGIVELRRSLYLNAKPYYNIADTFYTQKYNSLSGTLAFNDVRTLATYNSPTTFFDGKYNYTLDSTMVYNGKAVYVISAVQKMNKGYLKDPLKESRINTLIIDAETFGILKVTFNYAPKGVYDFKEFKNVTRTVDSVVSIVSAHMHTYEFGSYEGYLYLKLVRWSDWVQDFNIKTGKISHVNEYRHELLVNHVITNPSQFKGVPENMKRNESLHLRKGEYNKEFWKTYNVIYETKSDKRLVEDLMRKISETNK